MNENKKVYLNLGTVMKAKKRDENNPDESPRFYMKMEQQKKKDGSVVGDQIYPITLANGTVINDGDVVSLYSKREKLQAAVNEGKMSQDKADELANFLIFDVVLTIHSEEKEPKKAGNVPF